MFEVRFIRRMTFRRTYFVGTQEIVMKSHLMDSRLMEILFLYVFFFLFMTQYIEDSLYLPATTPGYLR